MENKKSDINDELSYLIDIIDYKYWNEWITNWTAGDPGNDFYSMIRNELRDLEKNS